MSRATDIQLDQLHGLLIDAFFEEFERYKANGEHIPPQLYAQAIKFLKDNGIDTPALAQDGFDRLASVIPDFGDPANDGNKPN